MTDPTHGTDRPVTVWGLFGEMWKLVETAKERAGHTGDDHFGMSYAHWRNPHGYPTDDADIRCGCGEILYSFIGGNICPGPAEHYRTAQNRTHEETDCDRPTTN